MPANPSWAPAPVAGREGEAYGLERLGRGAEAVDLYRRVAALRQQASVGR
ncbi:hypothetical protein ACWCQQ_29475 [Streptomyces sp. NPDC002143]